jgi:DNA-binding NtrC family response regulator
MGSGLVEPDRGDAILSPAASPRILIVDDEEAILETLSFTFMDHYEVLTTPDPLAALQILETNQPIAVVITDQRMPGMTGVELLKRVYERFPETVRIILTGFADSEATIQAINDGHIYGYVNKPWEPEDLKAMVRRAAQLHALSVENRRLVDDLRHANAFLAAAMDRWRRTT